MAQAQRSTVPWDEEFWSAIADGTLLVQICNDCGHRQFYPKPVCSECFSPNLGWLTSAAEGSVYSFTVVRVPRDPAFADEVPLALAEVELDEGVRLLGRVMDADPDDLAIGMRVKVGFEPVGKDGVTLPCFFTT